MTSGLDVVEAIGVLPTDPATEMPLDPVVIDSIKLVEK